jgi:tetratricopeptide (TPR) repeat protein
VTAPNFFAETELGIELTARGRTAEALPHFTRSLELRPDWPRGHANYGFALYMSGDAAAAVPHFERALELDPKPTGASEVHLYYGRTLAAAGRPAEAAAQYQAQLALSPDDRGALMGLAELRATEPEGPLRDGAEALALARRACTLEACAYPAEIDILALAIAAAGDPASAAKIAEQGIERARAIDDKESLARLERHVAVFQAGRAVTEPER